MFRMLLVLFMMGVVFTTGCTEKSKPPPSSGNPSTPPPGSTSTPPPATDRKPAVPSSHPLYNRVEGTSFKNDCTGDSACFKGGCSSEVCSAEDGVNTTCEVLEKPFPSDALCGCVSGQCVWYSGGAAPPRGLQGMPCSEGKCAEGLTCVSYYGIAGPSGPKFTSCEIPCRLPDSSCPAGQKCITIADGPGQVCRPAP